MSAATGARTDCYVTSVTQPRRSVNISFTPATQVAAQPSRTTTTQSRSRSARRRRAR
jgi:hypothetical protein